MKAVLRVVGAVMIIAGIVAIIGIAGADDLSVMNGAGGSVKELVCKFAISLGVFVAGWACEAWAEEA